jgi:hypothetical protein
MGSRDLRNALEGVDWGHVYAEAVAVALTCARRQDAEDMVLEGMRRVIEGKSPWDPAGKRTLVMHIVSVGNGEQRNERRKALRRAKPEFVEAFAQAAGDRPWTPEDEVSEREGHEHAARMFGRLIALSAGDPDALAVLECARSGIDEAAEQARHCGLDIDAIRNARKRVKRRAEVLFETEDDDEAAS